VGGKKEIKKEIKVVSDKNRGLVLNQGCYGNANCKLAERHDKGDTFLQCNACFSGL
jgi:hypothetical protein